MPEDIRVWQVSDGDVLIPVAKAILDLEARIEKWLIRDISVLSEDLLVIGRQVPTDFGGFIDLLCLDTAGDVIVVELKRDKTPREITAQALDYASWVKDLSNEQITAIADSYFAKSHNGTLESAYRKRFGADLPEILNERHRVLIVGSEIDDSSQRIIKYLSETYGVDINAATFQYFQAGGDRELLARVFVLEPAEAEANADKAPSKRRGTPQDLQRAAEDRGVGDLYVGLKDRLESSFRRSHAGRRNLRFFLKTDDGTKAILGILPSESNASDGVKFHAYSKRLADYLGMTEDQVASLLPANKKPWKYYDAAGPDLSGWEGFFKSTEDADRLIQALAKPAKGG